MCNLVLVFVLHLFNSVTLSVPLSRCRAHFHVTCDFAPVPLSCRREIVLDFLEVQGLREAVAAARGAGKRVRGWLRLGARAGGRGPEDGSTR